MPEKEGAEEKTTKSVVNKKQKQMMGEEGYDVARDEGRVKPSKDKKDATSYPVSDEVRKTQKKNKGPSAFEIVKKKYGKAVMDVEKKKNVSEEGKSLLSTPGLDKLKKIKDFKSNADRVFGRKSSDITKVESFDITKVAEAFGGYIVETETHNKKSFSQFRSELNESLDGRPGIGTIIVSKGLDALKSGLKFGKSLFGRGRTIVKKVGPNKNIKLNVNDQTKSFERAIRKNQRKINKKFSNNKSTVNPKDFNPLEYIKKTTERIKPEITKRGEQLKKTVKTAGDKVKENPGKTVVGGGTVVAAGETARRVIEKGTKGKTKIKTNTKTNKRNKRNKRTPGVPGAGAGGRLPRIGFKLPQTSHNVGRTSNPQ